MSKTLTISAAMVLWSVVAAQIVTAIVVYFLAPEFIGFATKIAVLASLVGAAPLTYLYLNQHRQLSLVNGKLAELNIALSQENKRARLEATLDPMTNLLNRKHFFRRTEERRHYPNGEGYFLMLDVDHFKKINDSYGHIAGDRALMQVTRNMQSAVREDDLVGRLGGEEFGIYLKNVNRSQAFMIAERLRQTVAAQPIAITNEHDVKITVSIGGVYAERSLKLDQLMHLADNNLYKAKNEGRNRVIIDSRPAESYAVH